MAKVGLDKVHFLDINSILSGPSKSWSPNTLRTRLVLNFKQIPYTQSYITYPSIQPLLAFRSIAPIPNQPAPYSLPAIIHAPSIPSTPTNHTLNDSGPIAIHLEQTFPAPKYPSIFPTPASYPLSLAVDKMLIHAMRNAVAITHPKVPAYLDAESKEYFERTREARFEMSLAELAAKEGEVERAWAIVEGEMKTIISMLRGRNGDSAKERGPFFEGDTPGYADLIVVAFLAWYLRGDVKDWERLMAMGQGELRRLWDACLPWLDGQGEDVEIEIPGESK